MKTEAKGFIPINSPLYKSNRRHIAAILCAGFGSKSGCCNNNIKAQPTEKSNRKLSKISKS